MRRPGRGVALDRAKRAAVWGVIEAYRAQARVAGTVDFPEAATIAAVHLRRLRDTRGQHVADHVLVDVELCGSVAATRSRTSSFSKTAMALRVRSKQARNAQHGFTAISREKRLRPKAE